ncbi:MAG: DNA primase small subunit domain-containing protein [Promethearchaeia archaeon]
MKSQRAQSKKKTRRFLQLTFQDYYRNNADCVVIPDRIERREFGMEKWEYTWHCPERYLPNDEDGKKTIGCGKSGQSFTKIQKCPYCDSTAIKVNNWVRHQGFRSSSALLNELIADAPHSVYHSAAFYDVPVARHMNEKDWQGAELIFDIDADHLDCSCTRDHDAWRCNNPECGKTGTGNPPDNGCPECRGQSFSTRKWICEHCLEDAKQNTLKIYDEFLVNDFGIDPSNIQMNYSGHRGYHIRVQDPRVFKLDSNARIEIVHYIMGVGFKTAAAATASRGRHSLTVVSREYPLPTAELRQYDVPGWGNRLSKAMIAFIRKIDSYEGDEQWVKRLKAHRAAAIEGLMRTPPILSPKVKGIGEKFWGDIAMKAVEYYGGETDIPVTHDIHRVIRLIGSLNGKTGFQVCALERDDIDDFDPFTDALAFHDGSLTVRFMGGSIDVPEFRIGDTTYGPYNEQIVDLPMPAAIFALCKGVATIESR